METLALMATQGQSVLQALKGLKGLRVLKDLKAQKE
jgi:hypothetical protein